MSRHHHPHLLPSRFVTINVLQTKASFHNQTNKNMGKFSPKLVHSVAAVRNIKKLTLLCTATVSLPTFGTSIILLYRYYSKYC